MTDPVEIRDLGLRASVEKARASSVPNIGDTQANRDREKAAVDRSRIEALCASVIPGGRRDWARLDDPRLYDRVASRKAIALTSASVHASAVVWVGASGSGKTSLACAALRARIEAGCKRPLFAPAWKLAVARARHPLGAGEPEIVDRALKAELLVLDDLAEQHQATSAVPDVIFEREAEGLPLWVTTWQSPEEVARQFGGGIARRIFERAVKIDCGAR